MVPVASALQKLSLTIATLSTSTALVPRPSVRLLVINVCMVKKSRQKRKIPEKDEKTHFQYFLIRILIRKRKQPKRKILEKDVEKPIFQYFFNYKFN